MVRPCLAPVFELRCRVPVADLGTETLLVHLAHRQHDMRVRLGFAIGADVTVNVEVGDHAPVDELARHEVAGKGNTIFRG